MDRRRQSIKNNIKFQRAMYTVTIYAYAYQQEPIEGNPQNSTVKKKMLFKLAEKQNYIIPEKKKETHETRSKTVSKLAIFAI